MKTFFFSGAVFLSIAAAAQTMPLYDCIQQAVAHNYAIKIVHNQKDVAENNVTYTPFMPGITASGTQNQAYSVGSRTLATTNEQTDIEAKANNLNAGVALNWRLFDGLAMFATYHKQKEALNVSEQEVKIAMENLIAQVCYEYYNIIILNNRLSAAQYSLTLSQERYQQAMEMYTLGSSSGLDLRQAKIDFNADSSVLMTQQEALQNAYIRLNTLMNAPLTNQGYVYDSISLLAKIDRQQLYEATLKYNSTLTAARLGKCIAEQDLKIARALRYPTLNFNTGYNYSWAETPSSAVTYNRSSGFNWGFSLSWTLFDGFDVRRRIQNAKLSVTGSELSYLQIENNIQSELALVYNTYETNLLKINFETESVETAYQTLDAAMSRYKLGGLSGIEFREYQKNYLEAVERQLSATYQAKLSEITLRLMSGELITGL
ncbi:MAG: TolC family protein [Prevotellaceae bacterium]|jgi:outer membrane protein TolC|nr:TolC family protein [Prevotellaceae bacterium]